MKIRNILVAAVITGFVPGLFWAFLGLIGISESQGFYEDFVARSIILFPVVLLIWTPFYIGLARRVEAGYWVVLLSSVVFWFVYQFIVHIVIAYAFRDMSLLGVSGAGMLVYTALGVIFGTVFWILTQSKKVAGG